jgi:hypothetical protein
MSSLYSTAQIEVFPTEPVSEKTAHLLRRALQEALEEAADRTLDQFGIVNQGVHSVLVDEIEVEQEVENE